MIRLLLALALFAFGTAHAASSAQMLTPLNTSVLGGESREYSVRFFDALGRPAVGESVTFSNDACGFFHNGFITATVVTDATGTATATFTARPQGITCWLRATAGVQVTFNVFTYTMAQVAIQAEVLPRDPAPGEDFTIIAGAYAGAYPIYDAEITARVIPGSGSATISPTVGDSARRGRVDFEVSPRGTGGFSVELEFRGVKHLVTMHGADDSLQDMWWSGPEENGWGMSVVQHEDRLFAVIYAYDADGSPVWYVMPGGTWNTTKSVFTGALYLPRGTPYSAYDASRFVPGEPVGTASLLIEGPARATLAYTIHGVNGTKSITRQMFGPPATVAAPQGLGDMWWGGAAQNGWGIAILQQQATLFGVWFTYDAAGDATWFVMPSGSWTGPTTYQGDLYRTRGSPWLGRPYAVDALQVFDVGSFRIDFAGDTATFAYTIDGKPGSMPLMRQAF